MRAAIIFAGTLAAAPAAQAVPAHTACPRDPAVAVARSFRASRWVVRARLTAADDHWAGAGDSWTLFHTRTLRPYKGRPPARMDILTHGDDAGTWLDRGSLSGLGQDYLLFLRPAPRGAPIEGAAQVSDRCGASKPWSWVSNEEARSLTAPSGPAAVAARRRVRPKAASHYPHVGAVQAPPARPRHPRPSPADV
jgi:hypothetical protein